MASARVMLRREAQAYALRKRLELGIPLDATVDVYDAIRRERLWLLFEPLGAAFGIYQRHGQAAGTVINVKVHQALQRYTAAHELGHHVLGHGAAVDPERHITRWADLSQTELAAQLFAAEFLMPDAAVNGAAARIGLMPGHVDAVSAYQLSLRLRTSYAATITRLVDLEWIGFPSAQRLRDISPKEIKQRLLGRTLDDSRSDVWVIAEAEQVARSPLWAHVGDELVLTLDEDPTTGYRWDTRLPESMSVDRDAFAAPSEARAGGVVIGGPGARRLELGLRQPATAHARLELRRPWEQAEASAAVDLIVDARERPLPGLDPTQRPALLAS